MNKKQKLAMVILAAGESKRMNTLKQLLPWKNTTLLGNAIEQGLNSNIGEVFVVLGANSEKIKDRISNYSVQIIENKNWQNGMGNSIGCALNYFKINNLNYDAVLITLADQPLINTAYYNLLIQQFSTNKERIAAGNINNKPSVPAIFDAFYFEKLSQLNEDMGAKDILKSFIKDVFIINSNVNLVDVDTFESYQDIFNSFGKPNILI